MFGSGKAIHAVLFLGFLWAALSCTASPPPLPPCEEQERPVTASPAPVSATYPLLRNLIGKLGAENISERFDAMVKIKAIGVAALETLEAALDDPDPEVRSRIRDIIREIKSTPEYDPKIPLVLEIRRDGRVLKGGRFVWKQGDAPEHLQRFIREYRHLVQTRLGIKSDLLPAVLLIEEGTTLTDLKRVLEIGNMEHSSAWRLLR